MCITLFGQCVYIYDPLTELSQNFAKMRNTLFDTQCYMNDNKQLTLDTHKDEGNYKLVGDDSLRKIKF